MPVRHRNLLLTLTLLAVSACATLVPHEYLVTREKLAAKLEHSFPVQRELGQGIFSATLKAPELGFIPSQNRISIATGFSTNSLLIGKVQGDVSITGGLRYDIEQRALFLQDARLDQLTTNQGDAYAEVLRPALEVILGEYLRVNPVYRFQTDELRFAGTDIDITGIEVVTNGIRLKLSPRPASH